MSRSQDELPRCREIDDIGNVALIDTGRPPFRGKGRPSDILIHDADGKTWYCTARGVELKPQTPFAADLLAALVAELAREKI